MNRKKEWLNHLFNFLAVILGVYLAFYVSERAKQNEDRKESLELMNSMIADITDDIKTYEDYQIPFNIQHKENVEKLLELLIADSLDGIGEELSVAFQVENFAPTTSTYSSMKSSGKLRLIEDLALRKKLSDYYEVLVPESIKKGDLQADYFVNELLTWFTYNVDLLEMEIKNKDELNVLKNQLIIFVSLIDQKISSYEMIVEESNQLKQQIEQIVDSN